MRIYYLLIFVIVISSCGTPNSHFRKQRSPSDIKIQSLDIAAGDIQIRFEYRSYVSKTLESLSCELDIGEFNQIKFEQQTNIMFESFATENIGFTNIESLKLIDSTQDTLSYHILCEADYGRSKEFINKSSVLYKVPNESSKYR